MFFDNLFSDFEPFSSYTYRPSRRETAYPFQSDNRTIILRKLLNEEYNYICFDCHSELEDLNYFDIKNGIFLCYNCAEKHTKLPKEITSIMTGNIRNLEESDLMILYYGGNKNLIEFIKRHFPLLENMQMKEMYSSKAMDYYRKLLRSKAFDEEEPSMPGKKKGYKSIFFNKVSPSKENARNNEREREREREENENMRNRYSRNPREENDEDDNIFSNTFFGDDLFGRYRRNQNQRNQRRNDDNDYMKTEPADINHKKEPQIKKIIPNKKNNTTENKKEAKTQKADCEPEKIANVVTINQIGEENRYPDAMEIDGMECD